MLVTASYAGTLTVLELTQGKLRSAGSVRLGFEPVGVAVSHDGKLAYVALESGADEAVTGRLALRGFLRLGVGIGGVPGLLIHRWPSLPHFVRVGKGHDERILRSGESL